MNRLLLVMRSDGPQIALVAVMSVVATLGFEPTFGGWGFVAFAVAGSLLATTTIVLAQLSELRSFDSIVVSILVFFAVGAIVTQGIALPGAALAFWGGLTAGWSNAISSIPPVRLSNEFRVLPFAAAWMGTMAGLVVLRSVRTPGMAVVGPFLAFVLTMIMNLESRTVAIVQGAAIGLGALVLSFLQQRTRTARADAFEDTTIKRAPRTEGLLMAAGMLTVIAVSAPLLGPRLPFAEDHQRVTLRDFRDPPFDPLREPTPLVQIKAALQESNADVALFTVSADRPLDRFTLAVLDTYTSEFWSVANADTGAPAQFLPVDAVFPEPGDSTIADWERISIRFEIRGLQTLAGGEFDPPWLPSVGWPVAIDSDEPLDIRFNPTTGTIAIAPDGPAEGTGYEMVVALPPEIDELSLGSSTSTLADPFDLAVPQLRAFAADVLEGADPGWEQVESIRAAFVDNAAYDSREDSETGRPGHSLGRLAEFVNDPDRVVGFEEQFAATAALIARSEGLPARVAVGYRIEPEELTDRWVDGQVDIRADDMSAWIEVRFDGVGWLPFDVTPPRDRLPEDASSGVSEREVAVPNPPPPPPPPVLPPRLDDDAELEDEEPVEEPVDKESGAGLPVREVALASAISSPVLLGGGLAAFVAAGKRRRSTRRRSHTSTSKRVAGAWFELTDRFSELGSRVPSSATSMELASGLVAAGAVEAEHEERLLQLARRVDRAAFHPDPPLESMADEAWQEADMLLACAHDPRSGRRRTLALFDPRPILRDDPIDDDGDGDE